MSTQLPPSVLRWLGETVAFYRYSVNFGPTGQGWQFHPPDQRRDQVEILAWLEAQFAEARGTATTITSSGGAGGQSPWSALTSRAGSVSSPAKTRAARRNGKKGGRPKKKILQNKGWNG